MSAQSTLSNPNKLADLVYALECGKCPNRFATRSCHVIAVSSSDYPELQKLFVVPRSPVPTSVMRSRNERDRWVAGIIWELHSLRTSGDGSVSRAGEMKGLDNATERLQAPDLGDVLFLTILVPGSDPKRVSRFSQRRIKVRFLSALEHLWLDRLRIKKVSDNSNSLAPKTTNLT
jgi:hypothetical protein